MKKVKNYIFLLISGVSLVGCSTSINLPLNSISNDSIVYVTYSSGLGTFFDGTTTKTLPIRKSIRWGKRTESEIPSSPSRGAGFKFNYYTNEDGTLISDDTRIKENINVVANYSVIVPGASEGNFKTNTWYQLSEVASKGFDNLKSVYSNEYKENNNTFVGLTKDVVYNNKTYSVRVIGENHDTASNGKTVPLTFEFTTPINGFVYDSDTSNSNVWLTSNLRTKLNNDILNLFEDGVKENVKSIKKVTHKGRVEGEAIDSTNTITTNEKLFILSIKEMGISAPSTFPPTLKIVNEGNTYSYYSTDLSNKIIKYDTDNNAVSYFLRSPSYDSYSYVWGINKSGELGDYESKTQQKWPYEVSISRSISPCFGIGEN